MPLPSVDELQEASPAQRQVQFTEADISRAGAQFEAGLPQQRVTAADASLLFAPAFGVEDSGLSQAAYAIYSFAAEGYNREPELRLNWAAAPEAGTLYIALANFETSRWDWFMPAGAGDTLAVSEFAPFLSGASALYAAVLVAGDVPAQLASLRLGPAYPQAALSVTPGQGTAPLEVSLDATASSTPEGELVEFEWDFDGDGAFDASSAGSAAVLHTYESGGDFNPLVRVTNSFGKTAEASAGVTLLDEWRHSLYSGGYWLHFNDLELDAEGGFYAVGYYIIYQIDTDITYMLVSRWNRDGELLWCKSGDDGYQSATHCVVDSQGRLLVAGSGSSFGMLQQWSPAGELLWSRDLSRSMHSLDLSAMRMDGDEIYVCGTLTDTGGDDDALLLRAAGDGSVVWARSYSWFGASGVDLELRSGGPGEARVFALASVVKDTFPTSTFPLVAAFDTDGNYLLDARRDNPSSTIVPQALALEALPAGAATRIYIASESSPGASSDLLLSAVDCSAATALLPAAVYENVWQGSGADVPLQLQLAEGKLRIAGISGNWAGLWTADALGGTFIAAEAFLPQQGKAGFEGLRLLDGGRFAYCGGIQSYPGQWQALPATQQSFAGTWMAAAGSVSNEGLTVTDGSTDFIDFGSTSVDVEASHEQALIGYRRLP